MKPVDLDTRERRQLRGRAFAGVEGSDELGLAKRVALGTCGARAAPLAAMGVFVLAFAVALVISLASHAAAERAKKYGAMRSAKKPVALGLLLELRVPACPPRVVGSLFLSTLPSKSCAPPPAFNGEARRGI